jgi:hypothetical protein
MIKFIKRLLGLAPNPVKTAEEVKAIFIPQMTTAAPNSAKTLEAQYIPPAKPVNKVKALGESGAEAVKAATAPKPANKKRRPYRGNKNAGGAVATEGKAKGGNGAVKQQPKQTAKPQAPKAPAKKK